MKPSNNTVSADKSAFTEEKVGWAFFHAGVAAGLSISRDAKGIDTSWVVFNKPAELSNRHAGFLLALGLNGHLKSIAKWVAFKYLTPKHTMTSIGLLLGLSASYLGTMDSLVTRLLSVHVTRMLPPGAAELNLSPLTQTAGIMGIGLLYCNTQHRRMSEVMLSEIEFVDPESSLDNTSSSDNIRDESYRLAAGFALGFINLGRGRDLRGLHDMQIVERLLALAVGSKKISLVHILDKSTAAATVAIALIFMKSNDEALARKIDVPDTIPQFDYVRPDILLLRTVAKHLIMWDSIEGSVAWVEKNLPISYRKKASLKNITFYDSEDLPLFNIIAGLCMSLGLRFAGSGNLAVRDILIFYLDAFFRLGITNASGYDQKLTRNTVRNCQDLISVAAASVVAGTGDLQVLRRLRLLHSHLESGTYGSHLAGHIAIGALFLGGGNFTFSTSNLAVASLLCAFYPLFPKDILDNKSHLQAFRHFWVLATSPRCIVPRDVATHRPVSLPIVISLTNGQRMEQTAPCLLPELSTIASVATNSPEHWRVMLDFANNKSHIASFIANQNIFVRRRAAHDTVSSIFQATLRALDDTETSQSPLEWILQLSTFSNLDKSEGALVLPPDAGNVVNANLDETVVDTRLILERGSLGSEKRDRIVGIKLIFAFVDALAKLKKNGPNRSSGEDFAGTDNQAVAGTRWISREVVDGLRALVWMSEVNQG
jgi:anaphase-promoting complex subunit 1